MSEAMRRANGLKSKVRSRVEHVFAAQKDRMDLFIRTVGIARATTKIGMANLASHSRAGVRASAPMASMTAASSPISS